MMTKNRIKAFSANNMTLYRSFFSRHIRLIEKFWIAKNCLAQDTTVKSTNKIKNIEIFIVNMIKK